MNPSPSAHLHANKLASPLSSPITNYPQRHSFVSKQKLLTTCIATTSPHLKRTQGPLPPYPPKTVDRANFNGPVKLGRNWADYHGAQDWQGLLNPLDDNLRSEILRYGNFVEAAYRAFDFDPSSPTYATCRFRKRELLHRVGFPATGYRITKNLRATSGIELPSWTEKAAGWAAVQSSWIGYVAVCTDKSEIQRLGRRDVVIALRGTATCLEWMENLRATLTPLPGSESAMVESGFRSLYTSSTATCRSLQETLRGEVARILETYKGEEVSLTMTGHSLGAALATMAAYDVKREFKDELGAVTVMSFGGPRVGDRSFRCHVEREGIKILRVVNSGDVVTRMPGFEYVEVGSELRLVDESEYNVAKCHELKTYLSLVGSSVGTQCCPVRQAANRWLPTAIDLTNIYKQN